MQSDQTSNKGIIIDKEEHYILMKGSFLHEVIRVLNEHVPHNRASNYRKEKK